MQIQQSVLNSMLKNIKDPKLRQTYGTILRGGFPYKVYCMNPQEDPESDHHKKMHPKGLIIGFIDDNGVCLDNPMQEKKTGRPLAGIETSRDRFDGRKGFRCYCGNWSIQAPEERGVLEQSGAPTPPTKEQMEQIFSALQKNGGITGYNFVNGKCEYDGFMVEKVEGAAE